MFEKTGCPLADAFIKGYNATIFAYGQTGAGKTYTIQGLSIEQIPDEHDRHKLRGIMPRTFEYIIHTLKHKATTDTTMEYILKCSYIEIYQEQLIDLLNTQAEGLRLHEDIRGVRVENLSEEVVESEEDLEEVLRRGSINRHIAATSMNSESSRSHSVFMIVLETKSKREGLVNYLYSKFNIIDLAGSERQKVTEATGERLKEAGKINRSLSVLGNVINSLVDIAQGKSRHVHYRDSKLTFLLKNSLGGNSKTVIIANISPLYSAETLSTLNFAKRAKMIKNKAIVNEDTAGTVLLLQKELKRLKAENAEFRAKQIGKCSVKGSSDIESLLQSTVELRNEDMKFYEQIIKEKDKKLDILRQCVKRCQYDKGKDRMIIKLKEAALAKVCKGDTDSEIETLRAENKLLREREDEALEKIVAFATCIDFNSKLMEKINEQNEYIVQMSERLKDLLEERMNKSLGEGWESMEGNELENDITRMKLEYIEKIEELSQRYIKYSERMEKERIQLLCENKEKEVISATIKQIEAEQYFKSLIENYEEMVNNNSTDASNKDLEAQVKVLVEENEELNKRVQQLNTALSQKGNDAHYRVERRIQDKCKSILSEVLSIRKELTELKSKYQQTLNNHIKEHMINIKKHIIQLTVILNMTIERIKFS
jgi:hypothetical protein